MADIKKSLKICVVRSKVTVPKLWSIDIKSLQNRLLKVCYVPATSASLLRVSFFFSFFVAAAIKSTNKANKEGGTRH
jgi:hypothetical protein